MPRGRRTTKTRLERGLVSIAAAYLQTGCANVHPSYYDSPGQVRAIAFDSTPASLSLVIRPCSARNKVAIVTSVLLTRNGVELCSLERDPDYTGNAMPITTQFYPCASYEGYLARHVRVNDDDGEPVQLRVRVADVEMFGEFELPAAGKLNYREILLTCARQGISR